MKPNMKKEERVKYFLAHYKDMTYDEMAEEMGFKNGECLRFWARKNKMPNKRNNSQALRNKDTLPEMIAKTIKTKKKSVEELADRFNVPPKKVREAIQLLERQNIVVDYFGGEVALSREIKKTERPVEIIKPTKEETFAIGAIADTHLGSKYERTDVLNAIYDRFEKNGVKTVYHGGNWIEGESRFNKYDIYARGVNEQVKNFVEKYPHRKGIKTHIISGDDHEGWYVQREHINIGQVMEDEARRAGRDDLIDLGYMERDIVFKKGKGQSVLRVIHAGGGSTYAISYTAQKYAESLQGGEKPSVVIVGHYHKFEVSYPREIYIVQPGCTQDQTPFMRKKKIQAMIGGCILWITQDERGIFTSLKTEFFPFFDKKFYQYKW